MPAVRRNRLSSNRVGSDRRRTRPPAHFLPIGPPLRARGYQVEMLLTPDPAGGTDIRWTGSITEHVRRTAQVMRILSRGVVGCLVYRIVKAAERQ